MKRILLVLEEALKVILVAAILLWLGDWAVFRLHAAHGGGFDTVQVQEYLSTALKGNKQEYDYMGTEQISCARALFPHAGVEPCWWVRRHATRWE